MGAALRRSPFCCWAGFRSGRRSWPRSRQSWQARRVFCRRRWGAGSSHSGKPVSTTSSCIAKRSGLRSCALCTGIRWYAAWLPSPKSGRRRASGITRRALQAESRSNRSGRQCVGATSCRNICVIENRRVEVLVIPGAQKRGTWGTRPSLVVMLDGLPGAQKRGTWATRPSLVVMLDGLPDAQKRGTWATRPSLVVMLDGLPGAQRRGTWATRPSAAISPCRERPWIKIRAIDPCNRSV